MNTLTATVALTVATTVAAKTAVVGRATWELKAPRIYVRQARVSYRDMYGRSRSSAVAFRIDGRSGTGYRVDLAPAIGPWEAIDGGEERRTLREAKALVSEWLRAANEQATLSPKL